MGEMILNSASSTEFPKLRQAIKNSRLSTDSLFGPIPENLRYVIRMSNDPPSHNIKHSVTYPAPQAGKFAAKYRGGPKKPNRSGSSAKPKGSRRAGSYRPLARQQQQHIRQQNTRTPKNSQAGRGVQNPPRKSQKKPKPLRGQGRGTPANQN